MTNRRSKIKMKKIISILSIIASFLFATSCQKELPDAVKNVNVSIGGQIPSSPTLTQELKVSEPGQFGAKGGELLISVTASGAWAISKSEGSDWLTNRSWGQVFDLFSSRDGT